MQIRFKTGPNKGKSVLVTGTEPILIGRENHCGLQIIDRGVSREHARIVRVGEMVFLHDLGSRNGSFVNGERVKEELLREGDTIRVGATQLVFESGKADRRDGIQYDEDDSFKSSLELNLNDLYVMEAATGRESEHFKAICQATNVVQVEREEKVLFSKLLDLLLEFIPASHIYIFIKDEHTGTVAPAAIKRKPDAHSAPISRLILRKVIKESLAILTADAMQDERFKSGDSIITKNIRSLICVPVASGGHVHGAIYAVNSSLTEAFDQNDLQLVTAIGSQLALAVENLHLTLRRRKVYFKLIGRLIGTLEGTQPGIAGHSERISEYCAAIAEGMGCSEREMVSTSLAALLHDLGRFPVLTKHLPVAEIAPKGDAAEIHALNSGLKLLEDIDDVESVLMGLRARHERFDGNGFPENLAADKIPLSGRIIAAACAFDKLLHPEHSRKDPQPDGAAVRRAFEELERRSGSEFDPDVVKAMMVAYRGGTLMADKTAARAPEGEVDLPEQISPHEASESLRKELAAISRLNTVRIKDGKTDGAKE